MEAFALFSVFNLLFFVGIIVFGFYFLITTIKSMRQRNEYLKDIRDELKEMNRNKTSNMN
ncbi:hypothetical protein [Fredinandcohnia sp. 179-A 10B2 NHS]|uniref:hypothetical protein n=1 Tax=Fredinandcohnia sp. 179-A 10B2 NHS TaxID=3235176 RepID=UPI0039A2DBA5